MFKNFSKMVDIASLYLNQEEAVFSQTGVEKLNDFKKELESLKTKTYSESNATNPKSQEMLQASIDLLTTLLANNTLAGAKAKAQTVKEFLEIIDGKTYSQVPKVFNLQSYNIASVFQKHLQGFVLDKDLNPKAKSGLDALVSVGSDTLFLTLKTQNQCNLLLFDNRPKVVFSSNQYFGKADPFADKAKKNEFGETERTEYAKLVAQHAFISTLPMVATSEQENLYFVRGQSGYWQTLIDVEYSLNQDLKKHGVSPLLFDAYNMLKKFQINTDLAESYNEECLKILTSIESKLTNYLSQNAEEFKHTIAKNVLDKLSPRLKKQKQDTIVKPYNILMDLEIVIRAAMIQNNKLSSEGNKSPGRLAALLADAHDNLLNQITKFSNATDSSLAARLREFEQLALQQTKTLLEFEQLVLVQTKTLSF